MKYETFKTDVAETQEVFRKEREEEKKKSRGLALSSLICGIIAGVPSMSLFSVIAIITGHIALYRSKKNPDKFGGRSNAKWGVGLGYFGLLLAIWIAVLKSQVAQTLQSLPH